MPRTKFLAGSAAIAMFGPALMQTVMKEAEVATPRDIDLLNKEIELENAGIIDALTPAHSRISVPQGDGLGLDTDPGVVCIYSGV